MFPPQPRRKPRDCRASDREARDCLRSREKSAEATAALALSDKALGRIKSFPVTDLCPRTKISILKKKKKNIQHQEGNSKMFEHNKEFPGVQRTG